MNNIKKENKISDSEKIGLGVFVLFLLYAINTMYNNKKDSFISNRKQYKSNLFGATIDKTLNPVGVPTSTTSKCLTSEKQTELSGLITGIKDYLNDSTNFTTYIANSTPGKNLVTSTNSLIDSYNNLTSCSTANYCNKIYVNSIYDGSNATQPKCTCDTANSKEFNKSNTKLDPTITCLDVSVLKTDIATLGTLPVLTKKTDILI